MLNDYSTYLQKAEEIISTNEQIENVNELSILSNKQRLANILQTIDYINFEKNEDLKLVDLLIEINKLILFECQWTIQHSEMISGSFRTLFNAYAGDKQWTRPIYGNKFVINSLVSNIIDNFYILIEKFPLKPLSLLSYLYLSLLVTHPFNDGNGRTLFLFIKYVAKKYFKINLYFPIDLLNCKLSTEFRIYEHKAYEKLIEILNYYSSINYISVDKRIKFTNENFSIGNISYDSLNKILNCLPFFDFCLNPLIDYFSFNKSNYINDLAIITK